MNSSGSATWDDIWARACRWRSRSRDRSPASRLQTKVKGYILDILSGKTEKKLLIYNNPKLVDTTQNKRRLKQQDTRRYDSGPWAYSPPSLFSSTNHKFKAIYCTFWLKNPERASSFPLSGPSSTSLQGGWGGEWWRERTVKNPHCLHIFSLLLFLFHFFLKNNYNRLICTSRTVGKKKQRQ